LATRSKFLFHKETKAKSGPGRACYVIRIRKKSSANSLNWGEGVVEEDRLGISQGLRGHEGSLVKSVL